MSIRLQSVSSVGSLLRLLAGSSAIDPANDEFLAVGAIDALYDALAGSWATKRVMHAGDSLMTGSNVAPGGSRIAFQTRVRSQGGNVQSWGPVISGNPGFPAPYSLRCAGFPGTTIAQGRDAFKPAGAIGSYLRAAGVADITFARWGTNDAFAGGSLAQMQSDTLALFDAMDAALGESTWKIYETLSNFFAPAVPVGGLATANALVASYNVWLTEILANRSPRWAVLDSGTLILAADVGPDGIHWRACGHAKVGIAEQTRYSYISPIVFGPPMPRPFLMRTKQASAKFTTKTTDQILFGVDNGWRLTPSNFTIFFRINPTSLANLGAVTALLQSTPVGQNYTHGFLVAYDSNAVTPTLNVYLNAIAAATFQIPIAAGASSLYWMAVHGDWNAGVVSTWMGLPSSPTAPLAPWVAASVGAQVGFQRWTLGDANPVLTVGANASFNGFAGAIDTIGMSQGASVPDFDNFAPIFEALMNEGALPGGLTAFCRVDEGMGATVASAMGGASGALTGAWSAAGTLAWPSDQ